MPALQNPPAPLPALEIFRVHIYADNSTLIVPGTDLYSQLYGYAPSDLFANPIVTLSTSQTFLLDANTTYWIGFDTSATSSLGWTYNQDISRRGDMARRFTTPTWIHLTDAIEPALRITVIPVPAAVWLLGSALGALGLARRRLAR
jgi:hypothetical protein